MNVRARAIPGVKIAQRRAIMCLPPAHVHSTSQRAHALDTRYYTWGVCEHLHVTTTERPTAERTSKVQRVLTSTFELTGPGSTSLLRSGKRVSTWWLCLRRKMRLRRLQATAQVHRARNESRQRCRVYVASEKHAHDIRPWSTHNTPTIGTFWGGN